jgi:hypothetical protein
VERHAEVQAKIGDMVCQPVPSREGQRLLEPRRGPIEVPLPKVVQGEGGDRAHVRARSARRSEQLLGLLHERPRLLRMAEVAARHGLEAQQLWDRLPRLTCQVAGAFCLLVGTPVDQAAREVLQHDGAKGWVGGITQGCLQAAFCFAGVAEGCVTCARFRLDPRSDCRLGFVGWDGLDESEGLASSSCGAFGSGGEQEHLAACGGVQPPVLQNGLQTSCPGSGGVVGCGLMGLQETNGVEHAIGQNEVQRDAGHAFGVGGGSVALACFVNAQKPICNASMELCAKRVRQKLHEGDRLACAGELPLGGLPVQEAGGAQGLQRVGRHPELLGLGGGDGLFQQGEQPDGPLVGGRHGDHRACALVVQGDRIVHVGDVELGAGAEQTDRGVDRIGISTRGTMDGGHDGGREGWLEPLGQVSRREGIDAKLVLGVDGQGMVRGGGAQQKDPGLWRQGPSDGQEVLVLVVGKPVDVVDQEQERAVRAGGETVDGVDDLQEPGADGVLESAGEQVFDGGVGARAGAQHAAPGLGLPLDLLEEARASHAVISENG